MSTNTNTHINMSHTCTIQGIPIHFPFQPYPCQFSMMHRILLAVENHQCALLESPTGTGKTLALLCALSAWQQQHIQQCEEVNRANAILRNLQKMNEQNQNNNNNNINNNQSSNTNTGATDAIPPLEEEGDDFVADMENEMIRRNQALIHGDWNEFSSSPFSSFSEAEINSFSQLPLLPIAFSSKDSSFSSSSNSTHSHQSTASLNPSRTSEPAPLPTAPQIPPDRIPSRIFFCSRTHSQITQVINALKQTGYMPRMAILASRQHFCQHPHARTSPHPSETCQQLVQYNDCSFYRSMHSIRSHPAINTKLFDIEDFLTIAERTRGCAYFAARAMAMEADIVFSPYNYLIEPSIRSALGIDLKDAIVVIDEAHNIEDVCKSSASAQFHCVEMQNLIKECQLLIQNQKLVANSQLILDILTPLTSWLEAEGKNLKQHNEGEYNEWPGEAFLPILQQFGIQSESLASIRKNIECLVKKEEDEQNPPISSRSILLLNNFINACDLFYSSDLKYVSDYKLLLRRESVPEPIFNQRNPLTLHFICLNPAVTFAPIAAIARTVILTSGTLAPLQSFESELGVSFPCKLEAPHIIDHRSLYVSVLSTGTTSSGNTVELTSSYKNADSANYHDALGNAIVKLCETVPDGIIVFFPSYSLIHRVIDRWKVTKLWTEIEERKRVFVEPRTVETFDNVLTSYIQSNAPYRKISLPSQTGGLLLAVCRGKVSEGINVSDTASRCIAIIGLPYPSVIDPKIRMKQAHNDLMRTKGQHQLLPGKSWLLQHTVRAINQAAGRVVRHRKDYGAVILIDVRFGRCEIKGQLSHWLRSSNKCIERSIMQINEDLSKFFNYHDSRENQPPESASAEGTDAALTTTCAEDTQLIQKDKNMFSFFGKKGHETYSREHSTVLLPQFRTSNRRKKTPLSSGKSASGLPKRPKVEICIEDSDEENRMVTSNSEKVTASPKALNRSSSNPLTMCTKHPTSDDEFETVDVRSFV